MKIARLVVVFFALMLLAAACGGQSAEEALLEQILESSGEDIGNIDVNTDDGDFSISVEGEDGEDINITGSGDDEDFSMTIEGEDGENINITGSGDDDDFSFTIEGEDGETFSYGGGEIPEGMQLPIADGGKVGSVMTSNEDMMVQLYYPATAFDQLVSFYDSQLNADSDEISRFESSYGSDDDTIRSVSWSPDSGEWDVSVSDCFGLESGELDSACVMLFEESS